MRSPGTAALLLPSPAEAARMDPEADPRPFSPPLPPHTHPASSRLPALPLPRSLCLHWRSAPDRTTMALGN